MDITVTYGDPLAQETPLLVFPTWQDEALPGVLANLIEEADWQGRFKQTLLLYPRAALPARRVLLVGLGRRGEISADRVREAGALATQRACELRVERYSSVLPTTERLPVGAAAEALVEGCQLALYQFLAYKSDTTAIERHPPAELQVLSAIHDPNIAQGIAIGEVVARGALLARDLINGPGNQIVPTRLGEVAQELGARGGIDVTVLGLPELQEQGFGGLLAVAQGSAQPPRFIVLEYGAEFTDAPTICLVGKGITFDTGGISLKPADRMEDMKGDMGGAAAVLGTLQALGELKPRLHVVGLISAAENMPGGTAYKPGDIIKTLSGVTVEIINTDAEGRMVLADALFYAQRYQPAAIIDLATLTGGVIVALGAHAIGLVGNNDDLAARLVRAGDASDERVWQLPLWEPYIDMVKSSVADIKNSAGRPASTITGGAFLSHFVGDYPWAHLDIAGTSYTERPAKAYQASGGIGVGVRLLVQALRTWATT